MEPASFEVGLSNKELLLTSLSHDLTGVLLVLMAVVGIVGAVAGQMGAIFFIIMLVIGWISGFVPVTLQFGGFHATRRGTRIEVEKGLVQREFSGIDVDRIQSVVVRQTFAPLPGVLRGVVGAHRCRQRPVG